MKTLVIYDETGKIYLMMYGEETAPQGIPCMFVDIPDGANLERIDVTNPDDPQPVFTYLPESDIGRLQKEVKTLKEDVADLTNKNNDLQTLVEEQKAIIEEQNNTNAALEEEITNVQLALTELYEGTVA